MANASGTTERYRIPVFVEGDTIALYRSGNKWHHTADLRSLETLDSSRCHYLSISALHHPGKNKAAPDSIGDLQRLFAGEDMKEFSTPSDLIVALKRTYPNKMAIEAIAEQKRKKFYKAYDMMPAYSKVIVYHVGLKAILAREDMEGIVPQGYGMMAFLNTNGALAMPGTIYFSADASKRFDTILEEVFHIIDHKVGVHCGLSDNFTKSEAWLKAMRHNLGSWSPLNTFLYRNVADKENTAKELIEKDTANKKNYEAAAEALPDIIRIEHSLIHQIQKEGALRNYPRKTTIKDLMDIPHGMPDLWKLYRGPAKGKRLVQDKQGHVMEIMKSASIPSGCKPVISFMEACQAELIKMNSDIVAAPPELPSPMKHASRATKSLGHSR